MAKRFFETAKHTSLYAKFRFPVSSEIISPIISRLSESLDPPHEVVVDVGCGTGQTVHELSKHFKKYIGVDVSEGQVAQANASPNKPSNAEYHAMPCEHLPFIQDNSVDVISASQSYHWFDHSKFCKEARRILKPGGMLAVYAYLTLEITSEQATAEQNLLIENARKRVYDVLDQYFDSAREYVRQQYRTVEFPYEDVTRLTLRDHFKQDLAFFKSFLQTMSPYQTILANDSAKAKGMLDAFDTDVKNALGNLWKGDETPLSLSRPYCVVLCMRPKE